MNACPDCQQPSHWGECSPVALAACRMRAWAAANPQCDTQGVMPDEWEALARAAFALPEHPTCTSCGRDLELNGNVAGGVYLGCPDCAIAYDPEELHA